MVGAEVGAAREQAVGRAVASGHQHQCDLDPCVCATRRGSPVLKHQTEKAAGNSTHTQQRRV